MNNDINCPHIADMPAVQSLTSIPLQKVIPSAKPCSKIRKHKKYVAKAKQ
jgi:hypothetical protein